MKSKQINFLKLVAVISSLSFVACDSGSSSGDGVDLTEIATTSEPLQAGDVIEYTSITSGTALLDQLTFTTPNIATENNAANFIYQVTTGVNFTLDGAFNSQTILTGALNTALGAGSQLDSDLRDVLLRDSTEPEELTVAELAEVVQILNTVGAGLSINENNEIVVATSRLYNHEVQSTVGDFLNGTLSGIYDVEESSALVGFREAFLNEFRLITTDFRIPEVSSDISGTTTVEGGLFILTFNN